MFILFDPDTGDADTMSLFRRFTPIIFFNARRAHGTEICRSVA